MDAPLAGVLDEAEAPLMVPASEEPQNEELLDARPLLLLTNALLTPDTHCCWPEALCVELCRTGMAD